MWKMVIMYKYYENMKTLYQANNEGLREVGTFNKCLIAI